MSINLASPPLRKGIKGEAGVRKTTVALLTATILASGGAPAFAQDVPEEAVASEEVTEAPASAEAIIVTGSRIRRQDLSGLGPATVVSDEVLETTGTVNVRSEEHTSELQSLMRTSYDVI